MHDIIASSGLQEALSLESVCLLTMRWTIKHRKSFTAAENVWPEKLVEVVSVTTRSNLRACRFQHFPWGRGRHASIPNYNHKAVDKLVLGGAEATQKIWYFYVNNISQTSYIVSKCFRKKASSPKLKNLSMAMLYTLSERWEHKTSMT